MQLTVITERGTFKSKRHDVVPQGQAEQLKHLLQECAEDGGYFTVDTESGYVVLTRELLKTAAFVVEAEY